MVESLCCSMLLVFEVGHHICFDFVTAEDDVARGGVQEELLERNWRCWRAAFLLP